MLRSSVPRRTFSSRVPADAARSAVDRSSTERTGWPAAATIRSPEARPARAAGLSSGAYLSSKLLVLGVISVVQSIILVLLGVGGRPMPPQGAFLKSFPLVEILLGIAVLALASMCLGLLVSALVTTSEKAMPFLVLLTMIQVILSGGVISLAHKAGLSQLAMIAPSRWGFGAVASTANLNVISPSAGGNFTDPLWTHSAANWLRDLAILVGLGVIFSLLTWLRLRRLGPRRRKG